MGLMPEESPKIRQFLLVSFYLSAMVTFIWLWVNNPILVNYNLQLTGLFVVFYFLTRMFFSKKLSFSAITLEIVTFTAILLILLSSTGGLNSPLFFLVYFLLFIVSLLFDPPVTLVLTLALTLFFAKTLTTLHAALQLLSIIFIAPLAIYFGNQYLRLLESQEKIKILVKQSRKLSAISNKLSANITNEETNSLLWLSLEFKNSLLKIIHQTSELLSDISHLTLTQKETLQSIHESAKEVLKTGQKLKEKIDKETD